MNNKLISVFLLFSLLITTSCLDELKEYPAAEPGQFDKYNANTVSNVYNDEFLYGSNMAYIENWKDEDWSDILTGNSDKGIEGIGVNSLRPALYNNFVERYGYDIRVSAFEHYSNKGAKLNVVFIGDRPHEEYAEPFDENGYRIAPYKNLYEPIWDDGENGTPVNDENYYALYVYKVALKYGKNIRFWEITNEPDYVTNGVGDKEVGQENNWWENDPKPEHLKNFKAPIQSYIRMLRVSYEVIKTMYPKSYICVGGLGYASFLDAILRNTDNPDGGKVTKEYPLQGGAWFDCLSYHLYPMYYLRTWVGYDKPNNIDGFKYTRHSDRAAQMVIDRKDYMFNLMAQYGYDGSKYPLKETIITEANIPHTQLNDFIGSQEAQRNFVVKTAILSQMNGISGLHIYGPADTKETSSSNLPNASPFDYCGFYKPLPSQPGGELRPNEAAIAWRTMTGTIKGLKYDSNETTKLSLPDNISGAAFGSGENHIYVLWAKTETDQSEFAEATYTFPEKMKITLINYKEWDGKTTTISGSTIKLSGSPVYILY